MAKKSIIARERKREKTVKRCASKRKAIKSELAQLWKNPDDNYDAIMEKQNELARLPRNASPIRQRNRCSLTGRPHGFYRKFGLGRNMLRIHAMLGNIPGLVKASW